MKTVWTDEQFEIMNWHDNYVHGLEIQEGEHGMGTLILDLDYIYEWINCGEGKCRFRVVPSKLAFNNVSDLEMRLDYAHVSAGFTPFSIQQITRQPATKHGPNQYHWKIDINWPMGHINFLATGYTQTQIGKIIETENQGLSATERQEAKNASNKSL